MIDLIVVFYIIGRLKMAERKDGLDLFYLPKGLLIHVDGKPLILVKRTAVQGNKNTFFSESKRRTTKRVKLTSRCQRSGSREKGGKDA